MRNKELLVCNIMVILFSLPCYSKDKLVEQYGVGLGVIPHYNSSEISNFNNSPIIRYGEGIVASVYGLNHLAYMADWYLELNTTLQAIKAQYSYQPEGDLLTQLGQVGGIKWGLNLALGIRAKFFGFLQVGGGVSIGGSYYNLSSNEARDINGGTSVSNFKSNINVSEYAAFYELGAGMNIFNSYMLLLGRLSHYTTDGLDTFGGQKDKGMRPTIQLALEL